MRLRALIDRLEVEDPEHTEYSNAAGAGAGADSESEKSKKQLSPVDAKLARYNAGKNLRPDRIHHMWNSLNERETL